MKRPRVYCFLGLVALSACASVGEAATIAHWSFDSATLSHDGSGNIVGAADSTGNHDASLGSGVGSASVANGGPTFNSNTIPGSNSVAGQFGRALTLSGFNNNAGGRGQFLEFPNLTELMTPNSAPGAPSYTVSYWIKTAVNAPQHQFTVLSDWGNAAVSPNTGRFTYGFGFNVTSSTATPPNTSQVRGQTRFNTTSGNGTDIYARAVTVAGINNGNWHMLTWTFDTTLGQLKSYVDSALVETFNVTAVTNFNMPISGSSVGTFGFKGDSGNFVNGSYDLDEAWVINKVLRADQIQNLYERNAIPEPSLLALASGNALGLILAARRRRA